MYSQRNEEEIILKYFGERKGNVLDVGANDGATFSNSLALIERGWGACLFEPCGKAFAKLTKLHKGKANIHLYEYAMGEMIGDGILYESGIHATENDWGLISTIHKVEMEKWKGTKFDNFTEKQIDIITWEYFYDNSALKEFQFITIDAEGEDFNILKQIDLNATKTEMICIETNGNKVFENNIAGYLKPRGFKLHYTTFENSIFAK